MFLTTCDSIEARPRRKPTRQRKRRARSQLAVVVREGNEHLLLSLALSGHKCRLLQHVVLRGYRVARERRRDSNSATPQAERV